MERKKMLKIVFSVFLIIVALNVVAYLFKLQLPLEFLTPPFSGFYRGEIAPDKTLFFFFWNHPQYGMTPLLYGQTLHSNELEIYVYAPLVQNRNVTLILKCYKIFKINETLEEKALAKPILILEIPALERDWGYKKIQLPITDKTLLYEVYYKNQKIFEFKYLTLKSYIPAPRFTLGSLFMRTSTYIFATTIICLIALLFAKLSIDRVGYVPKIPTWFIAIAPSLLIAFIGFGIYLIVYEFAVVNANITLIPSFAIFYFISLYALRKKPIIFYLMRILSLDNMVKSLYELPVLIKDNEIVLCSNSWKDFILGRKTKVELIGEKWYWKVEDSNDRIYVYDDIVERDGKLIIELAPLHERDVEAIIQEIITAESIAQAYHELQRDYADLTAKFHIESYKIGKQHVETFFNLLEKLLFIKELKTDSNKIEGEQEENIHE